MRSTLITRVVALGVLAIIGILALQAYWIYQSYNLKSKEFNERVNIALIEVAEKIAEYNEAVLPTKDLIVRESPNYYVVNIDDVIDPEVLEHYLYSSLTRNALNIDFEYAVFDCHTKEMVYGNYCSVDDNVDEPLSKPLPKYEEFTYYFGVRFPTKTGFVLQDMTRIWVVSGILGITLFFFGYAMYVILYQKKYSELQKDFINNMTHEFKTPVTSIKLSSDALAQFEPVKSDSRFSRYVDIIKSQNERINKHVEQVLNLAKLEKDHFKLNLEEIKVSDLVEQIQMAYELRFEDEAGVFLVNNDAQQAIIQADSSHLLNVLHNLIDNAIKYSKENAIHVTFNVFPRDNNIVFQVKDQGIGIQKEYLKRLTDKFFRVPKGDVHDVKGFGLGLYYVGQIVKAHRWKLNFESTYGVGTTSEIEVPIFKT